MRCLIVLPLALLAALSVAPVEVFAQNKKKKSSKATPQEYAKLVNVKELNGKLGFADGTTVSLQVDYSHLVPNPAYKPRPSSTYSRGTNLNGQYQAIQRDRIALARARNPTDYRRKLQQLQRDMQRLRTAMAKAAAKARTSQRTSSTNGPFKLVTEKKEFDLDVADKLIVRRLNPPFEYDDRGEVKTYTREELAKMRGTDTRLPGYAATISDLMPGQTVKVYLRAPTGAAKERNLLNEVEGVPSRASRPSVAMIVILP